MAVLRYFHQPPKQNTVIRETQVVDNSGVNLTTKLGDINKTTTNISANVSNKVDRVSGKGLSTNDFTNTSKQKLSGIEEGAEVNVQSNWDEQDTSSDAYIQNKPDIYLKSQTYNKTEIDQKIQTEENRALNAEGNLQNQIDNLNQNKANKATTLSGYNITDAYTKTEIDQKTGSPNGFATLDNSGIVPSSQLPSYVDDVLEYNSINNFPRPGESGKIYVDTTTDLTYRWSGSTYVEISKSLALGETSSTAYAGDKGKALADKLSGIESGAQVHKAPTTDEVKNALGTGNGTVKYLREDGTWQTPPDKDTTYSAGTGLSLNNTTFSLSLTKDLVTTALGYTPPTTDTNTWRPLGTGANDACAGNDSRLSNARPASDVYSWAKASTKPSYSYSEISGAPTKVSQLTNDAGYLTSADIASLIQDINTLKSLWQLSEGYVTTSYPAKAAGFYDSTM